MTNKVRILLVPKHALKYDIFWISFRHQKSCLIWLTLYENISNQKLIKGSQKVGKIAQKVGKKHQPNVIQTLAQCVTPTLAQYWPNDGLTSAQHWPSVGDVGSMNKSTLWGRQADLPTKVGPPLARLIDANWVVGQAY